MYREVLGAKGREGEREREMEERGREGKSERGREEKVKQIYS